MSVEALPTYEGEGVTWKFWIGLVVLMGAMAYVVTSSMDDAVNFYQVHEVAGQTGLVGNEMRVQGVVVDDSYRVADHAPDEHIFIMTTDQALLTISFKGALPDQFQDGADVVATGVLVDEQTMVASNITAQCPSRYEGNSPLAEEASADTVAPE